MRIAKFYSLIYLTYLPLTCLTAYGSNSKEYIEETFSTLSISPRATLAVSSDSVGTEEANPTFELKSSSEGSEIFITPVSSLEEESNHDTLPPLTSFKYNQPEPKTVSTFSRPPVRGMSDCRCKKKATTITIETDDTPEDAISDNAPVNDKPTDGILSIVKRRLSDGAISMSSGLANALANYSSAIYSPNQTRANKNSVRTTRSESSQEEYNSDKTEFRRSTERTFRPSHEKKLKELEERKRDIESKVQGRIELEKELENELSQVMTSNKKAEIIQSFENLKEFATQDEVFKLMRTANLYEEAKKFVYKGIYRLFELPMPKHTVEMVNQGWLCIRGRFEASEDAASQIHQMKFSPLEAHIASIKLADREFAEQIEEWKNN